MSLPDEHTEPVDALDALIASTDSTAQRKGQWGLWAAIGGLLATIATAMACVVPLVAVLLGVGGFGWLAQYAYLRVPATIATALLLAIGFFWVYAAPAITTKAKASRIILWLAAAFAVAVNIFEYVIFPRLA